MIERIDFQYTDDPRTAVLNDRFSAMLPVFTKVMRTTWPQFVDVVCRGVIHRVQVGERGRLVLLYHDREEVKNESALAALGGRTCGCVDFLIAWRKGPNDLRRAGYQNASRLLADQYTCSRLMKRLSQQRKAKSRLLKTMAEHPPWSLPESTTGRPADGVAADARKVQERLAYYTGVAGSLSHNGHQAKPTSHATLTWPDPLNENCGRSVIAVFQKKGGADHEVRCEVKTPYFTVTTRADRQLEDFAGEIAAVMYAVYQHMTDLRLVSYSYNEALRLRKVARNEAGTNTNADLLFKAVMAVEQVVNFQLGETGTSMDSVDAAVLLKKMAPVLNRILSRSVECKPKVMLDF